MPDSIVTAIIKKFEERANFGKEKYGTDLDRTDLKVADWILHAQEELMDGILYLEKLKKMNGLDISSVNNSKSEDAKEEGSSTSPGNASSSS